MTIEIPARLAPYVEELVGTGLFGADAAAVVAEAVAQLVRSAVREGFVNLRSDTPTPAAPIRSDTPQTGETPSADPRTFFLNETHELPRTPPAAPAAPPTCGRVGCHRPLPRSNRTGVCTKAKCDGATLATGQKQALILARAHFLKSLPPVKRYGVDARQRTPLGRCAECGQDQAVNRAGRRPPAGRCWACFGRETARKRWGKPEPTRVAAAAR